MFLLYSKIDSKCLSINISSLNITGRVKKCYKSFRGFRVFVFRYRVKNENAEWAENFLQHVYRKCHFPISEQRSYKAALVYMPAS